MAARIPLRVRVSGDLADIDRILDVLRAAGLNVSGQSAPRLNRYEPGHRVYATVRFPSQSDRTDDKRGAAPNRQASRHPAAPASPR